MSLAVTKSFRSNEVEVGRRNGELTEEDVERCLQEVGGTTGRTKKRRFGGLSPNLKMRRKKAVKEETAVVKLPGNGQFTSISHPAPLQWVGTMSNRDFRAFKSRTPVLEEIMNALTSVDVNVIGVYGIGGVGKTTLVKEAAKQAKEDKLFDEVVLATVAIDVKIQNIQGQIADTLGLKFDVETVEGRACQLYRRLKQEKKVLIILDDLWRKLDLEAVGIPSRDEHKGCKIILTSQDLNVLSNGMACQKNFVVGVLPEDEAWDLFKKMANENFEDPDLRSIAMEVVKVCGGLPLAIMTVARALKSKTLPEWKDALLKLRGRISTEMQQLYSTIEFIYRHLEGEELRSIFLLCGQMGHNATTRDLLKYGIGLGLFHNVFTLEQAQDKVHALVQKLKASCLLLDGNTNKQLVMHDVVRDAAMSIASKEQDLLIVDDEYKLKEWADEDKPKSYTEIWWRCNVSELPGEMQCPRLVFFLVRTLDPDLEVPGSLFKGLHKLKVLNLTGFSFSFLPPSLCSLKNLEVMCLHECVLENIGLVGDLKKLKVLSFAKSDIKHLPIEIGELANLRLLDLSDCRELEVVPCGVLSRLSRLEELCMSNSFSNWEIEGRNNASLLELKRLGCLTNLEIHIRDARTITKGIFPEKLCRYRILVGDIWGDCRWVREFEAPKILKLDLRTDIHMELGVIRPLFKKIEDIYLGGLKGLKNIVHELDSDGFPNLRHLHLSKSPDIQHIIDAMGTAAFPMLESLSLARLSSLEKISHYKLKMHSFSKLRIVKVTRCERLTYVFSFLVAQGLSVLEKIVAQNCKSMEEIVGDGSDGVHGNKFEATIEFSQLQSLLLWGLPKLRSFCSNADGRRSMPLFDGRILFPSLKHLDLRLINKETLWHAQPLPPITNSFQNLTNLYVRSCKSLKYLFPSSLVIYLGQLKYLTLCHCEVMEEVIAGKRLGEEQGMTMVFFPKLQSLKLFGLPKLTRFCQGYLIECPSLEELTISKCPNLKTFISSFTCTNTTIGNKGQENCQNVMQPLFDEKVAFPVLTNIEINESNNIEKMWHSQLAVNSFCELRRLNISGCGKLANIFPPILLGRFQKLEVLNIERCHLLEMIFEVEGLNAEEMSYSPISFQLRELSLWKLVKLKHIWSKDPQRILIFPNLQYVSVETCRMLKNVFPSSVAMDLSKLEKLMIMGSDVKEIVAKGDNDETCPCSTFPKLTHISLFDLSKLRSFRRGTGMHIWRCPLLKELDVRGFDMAKLFGAGMHSEGHLYVQIEQLQQTFPNLEQLSLGGEDMVASLTFLLRFPSNLFSTIKILHLLKVDEWNHILIAFLQKLCNLERLDLTYSNLEELFSYNGVATVEDLTPALVQLRHLEIRWNKNLRHIWEQNDHMDSLLQNLETLNVTGCYKLENLAPSSASFQNLTSLYVAHCHGLSNLITTKTAKSLGQLIHFEVRSCNKVTEIIDKEGDETKDEVIFTKLQSLKLVYLQSLTSFCLGNYTFEFPYLKEVHVERCPKMKVFSPAMLSTPKLRQVYFDNRKKHLEGNLNTTIKQLYIEQGHVVAQSIQPSSLQQPNMDHVKATKPSENRIFVFDGKNSNKLHESKSLDAIEDYTPETGTTTTITTAENAFKGSYAEFEITQTASTYQISHATLNDKTEPPQEQVTYVASIQQSGTAFVSSTSVLDLAPMSTFVSVAGRELPQETKRKKTVGRISNIEIGHDHKEFDLDKMEDEDAASNKPPTNPDMSSVDQKITPTTLTQSSLPQNASTSLCLNLAKLNEMCPEERLSFLLEQHNTMAIEAPTPTETVLEPTPIDVDQKVMAIKTVSNFLSNSIESLGDPTVVSDVQLACNLLCAAPVAGIVSLQQMIVIRNLSIELPLLTQRFLQASSIIGKDDCARFDLKHIFEEAASKVQEVALLTKKRSQLQNRILDDEKEIKNMEVQLAMLRSRVKQDKEAMADLGSSIRTAWKEADTWQLRAADSEKMNGCTLATVRKAKAEYEASKKQFEAHASLFFKT